MSTPRFVLSCLTSTCPSSSRLRTQVPLFSSPFFLLPLRSAISMTKILLCHPDASVYAHDRAFKTETLISTPKTTISTPKSLCLQIYIYSRKAFGKFDFRVFIVEVYV